MAQFNTKIRSVSSLYNVQPVNQSKLFPVNPYEESTFNWCPSVQKISEAELKKLEKQEERKARYDKRGRR